MIKHITIPQARTQLRRLAKEHDMPELKTLADRMYRKPPSCAVAPVQNKQMTNAIAGSIRLHKREHPAMSTQDLATLYGVNAGRVSEALNRTKTWEV